MSAIIIDQTRTVDPYSGYNSNVVNRLTRTITRNNDCIHNKQSLDITALSATELSLSAGICFKDDVLISVDSAFTIDMEEPDFYVSNPFNEAGIYYIVLNYNYIKSKPAPEAEILILKPSEHGLFTPTNYLFLKAATVVWNGATFEVTTLYDYDPAVITIKRIYSQVFVGFETTLPTFSTSDQSRIIYVEDEDKIYFGGDVNWRESSAAEFKIDNTLCPTNYLGYVKFDGTVGKSLANSFLTFAQCVSIESGKIKILFGKADIATQSGISIVVGDLVYLSSSESGTITNVRPPYSQLIGVCIEDTNASITKILMSGGSSGSSIDPALIDQITINQNNISQIASDIFGTSYSLIEASAGSDRTIGTIANFESTPNLKSYDTWYSATNGTNITQFIGCNVGDKRTIIFSNSTTTIRHNLNIVTFYGKNIVGVAGKTVSFVHVGSNVWHEISNNGSETKKITDIISGSDWVYAGVFGSALIDISEINSQYLILSVYEENEILVKEAISIDPSTLEIGLENIDSTTIITVSVCQGDSYDIISGTDWIADGGSYYGLVNTGAVDSTSVILSCFDSETFEKIIPSSIEYIWPSTIKIWNVTNTVKVLVNYKEASNFLISQLDWVLSGADYYCDLDLSTIDSTSVGIITTCFDSDTTLGLVPLNVEVLDYQTLRVWMNTNAINLVVNVSVNNYVYSLSASDFVSTNTYYGNVNISSIGSEDVVVSCYNLSKHIMSADVEIISANLLKVWSATNTLPIKVVVIG